MINNKTSQAPQKLNSVKTRLYEGVEGWAYAHHSAITFFKGQYYAIWSNGKEHEDFMGQRVMLSKSCNAEKWEKPQPIVTPEMLGNSDYVVTAAGFHIYGDTLNLYYAYYNYVGYDPQKTDVHPILYAHHENTMLGFIATKDGINWTKPTDLNIKMVPNLAPQKTSTGRLIISGNVMFPYTDNPNGADGFNLTGVYGDAFGSNTPVDDSESLIYVSEKLNFGDVKICEGSFFETDDNILHLMLRSDTEYLWHSESHDDGATWSRPEKTEYTDNKGAKMHFGRLPDGRFYGVCNPYQEDCRLHLVICVSEDGINFNRHFIICDDAYEQKYKGLAKAGHNGYPHSMIHNEYMYVIYTKGKESVELAKICLDDLK